METFEISSDRLAQLYSNLKCDGCGKQLTAKPAETWAKHGCGYFCAACLNADIHLRHSPRKSN